MKADAPSEGRRTENSRFPYKRLVQHTLKCLVAERPVKMTAERDAVVDVDAYLERIGVDPDAVVEPDWETLARVQAAHVQSVPFENLAIVGDPYPDVASEGGIDAEGVVLDTAKVYEKVVERERGGYCYELNGLFHSLLAELGYDVDRVAARVVGSDDDDTPPANHHSNVVHLHRSFVVDVGMGTPQMRQPTPLDGTEVTDDVGVTWRVTESDRPDAEYVTEYREPHARNWRTRYVFDTTPRELGYFSATNDHLQHSPQSPFTGDPVLSIASPDGYRKLDADTHTIVTYEATSEAAATQSTPEDAGTSSTPAEVPAAQKRTLERPIPVRDWHDHLRDVFGVQPRERRG